MMPCNRQLGWSGEQLYDDVAGQRCNNGGKVAESDLGIRAYAPGPWHHQRKFAERNCLYDHEETGDNHG